MKREKFLGAVLMTVVFLGCLTANISMLRAAETVMAENTGNADVEISGTEEGEKCGWTLEKDEIWEGDLVLTEGILDLNGYELTVTGTLFQKGGDININGGRLIVSGNYYIAETTNVENEDSLKGSQAVLWMQKSQDEVFVKGNFVMASLADHSTCLTDGTFYLSGDLMQKTTGNECNLATTGGFTLVLNGAGSQNVQMEAANSYSSRIANLYVDNTGEGIYLDGMTVTGNVSVEKGKMHGELAVVETTVFTDDLYEGDVAVNENTSYKRPLNIKGNLYCRAAFSPGENVFVDGNFSTCEYCGLSGNTFRVSGDIDIWGSRFAVNGGKLLCGGNLSLQYCVRRYSGLEMTCADGYVLIEGDMNVDNTPGTTMSAGTLELKGDFIQSRYQGTPAFIPSENFVVVLSGNKKQNVYFSETSSRFGTLCVKNESEEGVHFANESPRALKIERNGCQITCEGRGTYGWKLSEDMVLEDDLYLIMDELDLNGHSLKINGNLYAGAGNINVNGGSLEVTGDLRLQTCGGNGDFSESSGMLMMTKEEDYVKVGGDFVTQTEKSSKDCLTAGVLEVKGNFWQKNAWNTIDNFVASGTHQVIFSGDAEQTVQFEGYPYSGFQDVSFSKSKTGVTFETNVCADGVIEDEKQAVSNVVSSSIKVKTLSQFKNSVFGGNVYCYGSSVLKNDMQIRGTLDSYGDVDLEGHTLTTGNLDKRNGGIFVHGGKLAVSGSLSIVSWGYLVMEQDEDEICVANAFTMCSGTNLDKHVLQAGVLMIGGDVTIQNEGFLPSGTHRTVLTGKIGDRESDFIQTVTVGGDNAKFNELVLTKKMDLFYSFSEDVSLLCEKLTMDIQDSERPSAVTGLKVQTVTETSAELSWEPASDNEGVTGYGIYREGSLVGNTRDTTYTDTGLKPDSSYTYVVCAYDAKKNVSMDSASVTAVTEADTAAPERPEGVRLLTRTGSSVTIGWNPADDNVAASEYEIYRDGERIAGTGKDVFRYKDIHRSPGEEHHYQVRALDEAGNASELSEAVSGTAKMPVITRMVPGNGTEFGGETIELCVYYENVGNSTGNRVRFQYSTDQGANWKNINPSMLGQNTFNYSTLYSKYTWDIRKIKSRECVVKAVLYDSDENEDSVEVVCQLDTEPPLVAGCVSAESRNGLVILSWNPSGSANCTGYEIYRSKADGDFERIQICNGRENTEYTDREVEEGEDYTYYVKAVDSYGQVSGESEEAVVTVAKDIESPKVLALSAGQETIHGKVSFLVKAVDNIGVEAVSLQYFYNDKWVDAGKSPAESGTGKIEFDSAVIKDGEYMFRAWAEDKNGNVSMAYTDQFRVDNTGPEKVCIDEVTAESDKVRLIWRDVADEDLAYYVVEQKTGGEFAEAARESSRLGTYIRDLNPETSYTFRIVGYDTTGNRGEPSEEIPVTTKKDTSAPYVVRFDPAIAYYKDMIPIDIMAQDNNELGRIDFSYSYDQKSWTELHTLVAPEGKREYTYHYDLDIRDFREGTLYVRAVLYDRAGNENQGEPCIRKFYKVLSAPDPVEKISAVSKDGYIKVEWEKPDTENFASFDLYRKSGEDGKYQCVDAKTTAVNYFDTEGEENEEIFYKIIVNDLAGNSSVYSREVSARVLPDTEKPKIYGVSPTDGSKVAKNPKITALAADNRCLEEVTIEFRRKGSGDFWTEIYREEVNADSRYTTVEWENEELENGEYEFRVSARDKKGNVSKETGFSYILDKNDTEPEPSVPEPEIPGEPDEGDGEEGEKLAEVLQGVSVTVKGEDSGSLGQAQIFIRKEAEEDGQTYRCDTFGELAASLDAGTYFVSAYQSGYLPLEKKIKVSPGAVKKVNFVLESKELVTGTLTHRKLDVREIMELGVDLKEPSNWYVYEYQTVTYERGEPEPKKYEFRVSEGEWTYEDNSGNGNRRTAYTAAHVPGTGEDEHILVRYETVEYLKQMFEVELRLQNQAGKEFVITDGRGTLELPEGLSLAEMKGEAEQQPEIRVPDIPGQSEQTVKWYIRGDKPGEYFIHADYQGRLQPFDAPVNISIYDKEPVIVTEENTNTNTDDGFLDPEKETKDYQIRVADTSGAPLKGAYVEMWHGELSTRGITNSEGIVWLEVNEGDTRTFRLTATCEDYRDYEDEDYTINAGDYMDGIVMVKKGGTKHGDENKDYHGSFALDHVEVNGVDVSSAKVEINSYETNNNTVRLYFSEKVSEAAIVIQDKTKENEVEIQKKGSLSSTNVSLNFRSDRLKKDYDMYVRAVDKKTGTWHLYLLGNVEISDKESGSEYITEHYNQELAEQCALYSALAYKVIDTVNGEPSDGFSYDTGTGFLSDRIDMTYEPENEGCLDLKQKLVSDGFTIDSDYMYVNYFEESKLGGPEDNCSYSIVHRRMWNRKVLVYVIIRGTDRVEWYGNMEITRENYDASQEFHWNFKEAERKVLDALRQYVQEKKLEEADIVVTGHSRGAAVANLLAKDLIDDKDNFNREQKDICSYETVTAYTFATPYVTLRDDYKHVEQYANIYNFCFTDDFVPQVPLNSWGYNKYGRTATVDSESLSKKNQGFNRDRIRIRSQNKEFTYASDQTGELISHISRNWEDVRSYYTKKILMFVGENETAGMTLYEFMHDNIAKAIVEVKWDTIRKLPLDLQILFKTVEKSELSTIATYFLHGSALFENYIFDTHNIDNYYAALCNGGFDTSGFEDKHALYARSGGKRYLSSASEANAGAAVAVPDDINVIKKFLEQNVSRDSEQAVTVSEVLGWDAEDVSTWEGVTVTEGQITAIHLPAVRIGGKLDLTGLRHLKSLRCMYTGFEEVVLKDCPSLKELVLCENAISTLDLSDCDELESVNVCANGLKEIQWGDVSLLTGFSCNGNYLDTDTDETFLAVIRTLEEKGVHPSYKNQRYDESAAFSRKDVDVIKEMLSQGENETLLGWEKEDVSTWSGIHWKTIRGVNYINRIEIDGKGLTGTWKISELRYVRELVCGGNQFQELDVSGCGFLELLNCCGGELESLVLGENDNLLYLDCRNNCLFVDDIEEECKKIAGREGSEVYYERQFINAERSVFCESECEELERFAGLSENKQLLKWDFQKPGRIPGIRWEVKDGIYHVRELNFLGYAVSGSLDLSGFSALEKVCFAGTNIRRITLPDTLKELSENAFMNCHSLEQVVLPSELKKIGKTAFYNCEKLNRIGFPDDLTEIQDEAFVNCIALEELTFGKKMEVLGEHAFAGCAGLTGVAFLGDAPEALGREAFYGTHERFCIYYDSTCYGWDDEYWLKYTLRAIGEEPEVSQTPVPSAAPENTPEPVISPAPQPTETPEPGMTSPPERTTEPEMSTLPAATAAPDEKQEVVPELSLDNQKSSGDRKYNVSKVKILKCKQKKRTIEVRIQRNKTVSGYEVYYRKGKKGKFAVKRQKGWKKNRIVLKKLKKKKVYYIKVRAYKLTGGKKHYSAFTKCRKIRVN